MDLQPYLDRIGFDGVARPDLSTMVALQRSHLLSIPYENLDIQLGRSVSLDAARIYAKLVEHGRGGWCYEMNGLLAWALETIGIPVTRLAGAVRREFLGDLTAGSHLVLKVDLDEPWLVDAGFGDGPLEPIRLREGPVSVAGFDFRLERIEGGWWRFHNHPLGGAPSFDFREEAADPLQLAEACERLQRSPESGFVLNAVVQRHTPRGLIQMRGRTLRRISNGLVEERLVASAAEYVGLLASEFGLSAPEAASLWPAIKARHAALFGEPGGEGA